MNAKEPTIKYSLGPVQMIFYAIQSHRRRHGGKLPRRVELHPAVMRDFRANLKPHQAGITAESTVFLGVPVLTDTNADQPRLITHEGKLEFL